MITWHERIIALEEKLGRKANLKELLDEAKKHTLTPAEWQAQAESFARGMTARCEHGVLDFEQCPECRK